MAIYIDVDVARRIIESPRSKEQMLLVLSQVEPADVAPVVHGEWIPNEVQLAWGDGTTSVAIFRCSNCGYEQDGMDKYCSCCGAKMDLQ